MIKEGTKETALVNPLTIAISEKFAEKIFPDGNAMGKKIILDKKYPLTVTCVYEDIPENSELQASYMISLSTYESLKIRNSYYDDWYHIDWFNYVLLRKKASAQRIDEKLKGTFSNIKNMEKSTPYLLPLSKLHLSPTNKLDKVLALALLSMAALLILGVSFLNYVNLALVNSRRKARETGIKKVLGLTGKDMIIQSVYETVIVTAISMLAGVYFAQLLMPVISSGIQKQINVNLFDEPGLLVIIGITGMIAGVISGIYPALILSSYAPWKAMKINAIQGRYPGMKKVLVVSQFTVTLFMITVSLMIHSHVKFIENKKLGFNEKEILFSEVDFKKPVSIDLIKSRLKSHPEISSVSFSFSIPFNGNAGGYVSWDGAAPQQKVMISRNTVDYDFAETYGIVLLKGRFFSKSFFSDENGCVINEAAFKVFGWSDAEGRYISFNDKKYSVIGIVKDFHPFTVAQEIPFYVMLLQPDTFIGTSQMSVKYAKGREAEARKIIKDEMEALFPEMPVYLRDFDELLVMNKGGLSWKSVEYLFIFFSIIAILISVLGITGLVVFLTRRRIKEIGIRKVLGADVFGLYKLLTTGILKSMVVSVAFSLPSAFIVYSLMPGAYKEPFSLWCFISSIFIVTIVSVLTITIIIMRTLRRNPVEALRFE